jgi:phosphoglycolate phosphatase
VTSRTITAVVFDIDGTLITTGGAGGRAWGLAFKELYDVAASIEDHTEAGMPDDEVVRVTFLQVIGRDPAEGELASITDRYLYYLPETVAESRTYRVLPGVLNTLERLCNTGYLVGLTTGNIKAAAHLKLERGRLNGYFSFGGYGSDSPDRGELTRTAIERAGSMLGRRLDPQTVLVVGDTPRDVEAAHDAGAVSVAVASGHFSEDALRESGAEFVLPSLEASFPVPEDVNV